MGWVRDRREALRLAVEDLAAMCDCSAALIRYAEAGWPVHPAFADRIARALGASNRERDEIVVGKYRKYAGRKAPNPAGAPMVPVVEVDARGNELARYDGAKIAAEAWGIWSCNISNRCRRLVKNEFRKWGVTWRFASEWDEMDAAARAADLRPRPRKGAKTDV